MQPITEVSQLNPDDHFTAPLTFGIHMACTIIYYTYIISQKLYFIKTLRNYV